MEQPHNIFKSKSLGGLAVIRRVNWPVEYPAGPARERVPAVPLSHEEILTTYRGIDGHPWPDVSGFADITLESGLVPIDKVQSVESYFKAVSEKYYCDLLCLRFPDEPAIFPTLPERFFFLGYDYGYYSSEYSVYSSLFHEVVLGLYSEMRIHGKALNKNLLLPDLESVEALRLTRIQLLASGADLENDGEEFLAIAIYGERRGAEVDPEQ